MSTRTRSSHPLALALLLALAAGQARAEDDPMAPYRERFKAGMERYKAGEYAGAVASWEPIYRDVGPDKGYRVAFDLARAYEKVGDETRAAERYEAFIARVDARRGAGERIEPLVLDEETEARARLAVIVAQEGRVRVEAAVPTPARVDALDPRTTPFTAYVAPGRHVVTFAPGARDESRTETSVAAGQLVTVAMPAPPAASTAPAAPPPTSIPAPAPAPPPPPPVAVEHRPVHPFPAGVLIASSAVTAGLIVFTSVEYGRALSARSDFDQAASNPAKQASIRDGTYDGARTGAYVGLGASIAMAAITGALATWYLAGSRDAEVPIAPAVIPTGSGLAAGATGRF